MHYFVVALVPKDTPKKSIPDKVKDILAKYDENLSVPRWREYMHPSDVEVMAGHYKIDPTDYEALAARLKDWNGYDGGGIDEIGFYGWSTRNPIGKWDWYEIGGRWDDRITSNVRPACAVKVPPEEMHDIIEPNGDWHARESYIGGPIGRPPEECFSRTPDEDWTVEVAKVLAIHTDCLAVGLDIHR